MALFVNIETIKKGHWMMETPSKPNFRLYAWNIINMNVNYTQRATIIKGRKFVCNAGESLYSFATWDDIIGLCWGATKTRRFFLELEKRGYVKLTNEGVTTRVTVCHWGDLKNKGKENKQDEEEENTQKCNDFATVLQRLCTGIGVDFEALPKKSATTLQLLCNRFANNYRNKNIEEEDFSKLEKEAKQVLRENKVPKSGKGEKEEENPKTSLKAQELVKDFLKYSKKGLSSAEISQKIANWGVLIDSIVESGTYSYEDIEKSVKWAKNDKFWKSKFLSLQKLVKPDGEGVEYIEVFYNGYLNSKEADSHQEKNTNATSKRTQRKSALKNLLENEDKINSMLDAIVLED